MVYSYRVLAKETQALYLKAFPGGMTVVVPMFRDRDGNTICGPDADRYFMRVDRPDPVGYQIYSSLYCGINVSPDGETPTNEVFASLEDLEKQLRR